MPRVDSHCRLDSKRYLLLDKINILAYGNKDIKQQFQLKLDTQPAASDGQSLARDRGQGNRYLGFSLGAFNVEDYQRLNRVCGASVKDFAKAFDTVDHSALLAKLRLYGVKGQLFCWFKDYLTERTQRVVLENAASDWSPVLNLWRSAGEHFRPPVVHFVH